MFWSKQTLFVHLKINVLTSFYFTKQKTVKPKDIFSFPMFLNLSENTEIVHIFYFQDMLGEQDLYTHTLKDYILLHGVCINAWNMVICLKAIEVHFYMIDVYKC